MNEDAVTASVEPVACVLLAPESVPQHWRSRTTPVALVAITPAEAALFVDGEAVTPTLRPEDEQVLALLLAGQTVLAMARHLDISPRSVQRRLARLRKNFRVDSNTDLLVTAARAGFR